MRFAWGSKLASTCSRSRDYEPCSERVCVCQLKKYQQLFKNGPLNPKPSRWPATVKWQIEEGWWRGATCWSRGGEEQAGRDTQTLAGRSGQDDGVVVGRQMRSVGGSGRRKGERGNLLVRSEGAFRLLNLCRFVREARLQQLHLRLLLRHRLPRVDRTTSLHKCAAVPRRARI